VTVPSAAATVDLQVHSTASDGAVAPDQIPAVAASAGLSAFALTDHDSVSGVVRAQRAAAAHGVRVIAGVELSAMHEQREVHILGLHLDDLTGIDERLRLFRLQREERAARIVDRLRERGIAITYDDVVRQAQGGAVGRPHIARAMVASGGASDFRDAFDRFIGAGKPAYVAKPMLTVTEATRLVHDHGGIAIWAHPGRDGRRDALEPLVALGMDGVEVLHPGHTPEDVQRLRALQTHLGILPSGGSDWHGDMGGARTLGAMKVPAEWMEIQETRVFAQRAAGRA
jgi:predicted metal-dependent phosphoesterase TrpH